MSRRNSNADSTWQGHKIRNDGQQWRYAETGQPTVENPRPACGKCGLAPTVEGHDGCLGTLPNVMNACCGHGVEADAYVQFNDRSELRGSAAILYFQNSAVQSQAKNERRIQREF